jgi:hypothetical protein
MSDPELEPLEPELVALLERERLGGDPTDADRASVLGRLTHTLATTPVPPPTPSQTSSSHSQAITTTPPIPKSVLAVAATAIFGTGIGLGMVVQSRRSPPPQPIAPTPVVTPSVQHTAQDVPPIVIPAEAPAEHPVTDSTTSTNPSPPKTDARRPTTSPVVNKRQTATNPTSEPAGNVVSSATGSTGSVGADHDLAAERALLEIARTALVRGQYSAALEELTRHEAQFPSGTLAEDREALAVQALVGLGHAEEARSRAARFHASYPRSMMIPVVDAAIKELAAPNPDEKSEP